jgi:hypothetical protein
VDATTPAFSSQLVYLQFHEGVPLPTSSLRAPCPLCYITFFVVVYYSVWFFSSFSLSGGWSVQGAMLIWPRTVCWSTACRLAHLVVCVFPSSLGAGVWRHRSPPGFSIYHGVGALCAGWGCGGVRVLLLFGGFSCKVYLQCLSKILL